MYQLRDGREIGLMRLCWRGIVDYYGIGAYELADYFADEFEYWAAATPRSMVL